MIGLLPHFIRRAISVRREKKKDATRSPRWRHVKSVHLSLHPTCAGCGGTKHLQVHHILPFHLQPALELDPRNLVTSCMDRPECHLRICHGDSFKAYNPNVVADLFDYLLHPGQRRKIAARAKANRLT